MNEEILSLLGYLLSFLLVYKYVALFGISFLAVLVLPLPASSVLVASGALASQGYFHITVVLITAFAAKVAGSTVGYFIARYFGESFFHKPGLRHFVRSRLFRKLKMYILSFPRTIIFFTRFIAEVGPATNILSGIMNVPKRVFIGTVLAGELTYVLMYGLTGYFLGAEWENNLTFIAKAVMLMVSLGITINIIEWIWRRKHSSYHSYG